MPETRITKLKADIAEFLGKTYFILVDYYLKWLEIIPVKTAYSSTLIESCKYIFSRFCIPSELIVDNIPFDSYKFKLFSYEYKFKITTGNPYYPRSNCLTETFIGIAKKIIKNLLRRKIVCNYSYCIIEIHHCQTININHLNF